MTDDLHSTSYIDSEGEERCSTCDKWLERDYYTIDDHGAEAIARGRGQMRITGGPATWREPDWLPTTCAECGKPFETGQRIEAHSPESVWVHQTCPDTRRLTRDE